MTHQPSFSRAEFATKKKTTRREKFLTRMEALIPWSKLLAVGESFRRCANQGRLLEEGITSLAAFRTAACYMSSVFLVGVVAVYFLPETKGRPLPEDTVAVK